MQIAITGIGIVSALGIGSEANRQALLSGRSGLHAARYLKTTHHEWPVGEVPMTNEAMQEALGIHHPLSRNILLGLLAARETLSGIDTHSIAFCNGTTVGGMDRTESIWQPNQEPTLNNLDPQHEAGMTTELISKYMGGFAKTCTISTACSSALNAIMQGAEMILCGETKLALAGGTEALTRFHLNGFASLGILSKDICRPFEDDRDGINLGEGAAYLLLEEVDHARQRGATIYGYLRGFANRCDAYHQTASSPDGEGAYRSMRDALMMSGLSTSHIAYINAHGTATPNNDASEMTAIERLFGEHHPLVTSTKPLTGHTTSASGAIEAIFCLWYMQEKGYEHIMTNAFGFGGNDSSLVISKEGEDIVCMPSETETGEAVTLNQRRQTPAMKELAQQVQKCLSEADIDCPDAIIVATRWGFLRHSMNLLNTLAEEGEQNLSPALFMQSTHNTPASTLAMMLHCHGYNLTISDNLQSLEKAEEQAQRLIELGEADHVLVCLHDEMGTRQQARLISR